VNCGFRRHGRLLFTNPRFVVAAAKTCRHWGSAGSRNVCIPQGMTLDRCIVHLTDEFCGHGQAYVALSRGASAAEIMSHFARAFQQSRCLTGLLYSVKSLEGLWISSLPVHKITAHPRVKAFYDRLASSQQSNQQSSECGAAEAKPPPRPVKRRSSPKFLSTPLQAQSKPRFDSNGCMRKPATTKHFFRKCQPEAFAARLPFSHDSVRGNSSRVQKAQYNAHRERRTKQRHDKVA